jgi:hypothetical protein
MEHGHSIFSRLTTFQTTVLIVVAVLVLGHIVKWWFKPEPKTIGALIVSCLIVVAVGAAVLYFVKPRGQEFELLKRDGVQGIATVLQVESMNVTVNRRSQVRLRMRVELEGKPPYELTHIDFVGLGQSVIPGRRLTVYVDRNQRERLVIDWGGSTEPLSQAAPSKDVSARLAELDRLRERGQITQEEYEAHRQRLLSEL